MSSAPGVVTCECGGRFQLPPGGLSRAVCPNCRQEVFVSPQGLAKWVAPPPLATAAPSPYGAPPKPAAGFRNPLPVIIGVAVFFVLGMGFLIVLCAGAIYYRAKSATNLVARGSTSVAPVIQRDVDAPPPRELVRFADYESSGSTLPKSPGREFRRVADRQKSQGDYEAAEKNYLAALQADPNYANAAYQLACNYVLDGKLDQGKKFFDRAIELGFCDYGSCVNDDELGAIRDMPDFPGILETVRKRYYEEREKYLGAPVLFEPENGPSKALIVLLHGYGDSHESYFDNARAFNKLGFRAVALPGSLPFLDDGFHWSDYDSGVTHAAIQKVLADPLVAGKNEKVFLLGFSQGAAHALDLIQKHPEIYAGGVILSPGGRLSPFDEQTGHLRLSGNGCLYVVHGDEEPHGAFTPLWRQDCQAAGWRFEMLAHPGGHHFPVDWEERLPAIAKFLLNE